MLILFSTETLVVFFTSSSAITSCQPGGENMADYGGPVIRASHLNREQERVVQLCN